MIFHLSEEMVKKQAKELKEELKKRVEQERNFLEKICNDWYDIYTEPIRNLNIQCFTYKNNKFVCELELPGFKKEHISITLDKENISILAEKIADNKTAIRKYTVNVPRNSDKNTLEASMEDGILILTLQLKTDELPLERKITIK